METGGTTGRAETVAGRAVPTNPASPDPVLCLG